jgi:hypothetical protein
METDLTVAEVARMPACQLCPHKPEHAAEYDFAVPHLRGQWAYGCAGKFRAYSGSLGTGRGQRLVVSAS